MWIVYREVVRQRPENVRDFAAGQYRVGFIIHELVISPANVDKVGGYLDPWSDDCIAEQYVANEHMFVCLFIYLHHFNIQQQCARTSYRSEVALASYVLCVMM